MQKIQIKNLTWVDIVDPKQSDIDYLKSLNFYPVVLNELKYPTLRPKVEQYDNYLYMILHFPIYHPREKTSKSVEIDFLITKYALVTVRYGKNQPLQEFWNKCKVNDSEPQFHNSSASLLYCMLQELNNFSLRQIDHITQKVEKLEKEIFDKRNRKNEEEIVENISVIRRDILDFRRTIKPHETILNSLKIHGMEFFGKATKAYFNDIVGDYMRVWDLLDNHKETIESLQQANDSILSNRTNRTVRTLTILTSIIFSLTLLATLFSTNAHYTPIIGARNDFWIIAGILATGALIMLFYYKKKRWL